MRIGVKVSGALGGSGSDVGVGADEADCPSIEAQTQCAGLRTRRITAQRRTHIRRIAGRRIPQPNLSRRNIGDVTTVGADQGTRFIFLLVNAAGRIGGNQISMTIGARITEDRRVGRSPRRHFERGEKAVGARCGVVSANRQTRIGSLHGFRSRLRHPDRRPRGKIAEINLPLRAAAWLESRHQVARRTLKNHRRTIRRKRCAARSSIARRRACRVKTHQAVPVQNHVIHEYVAHAIRVVQFQIARPAFIDDPVTVRRDQGIL